MQGKEFTLEEADQQRTHPTQLIGSMDQRPHSSFTPTFSHLFSPSNTTSQLPPATVKPLHQLTTPQYASYPPGYYLIIEVGNPSSDRLYYDRYVDYCF